MELVDEEKCGEAPHQIIANNFTAALRRGASKFIDAANKVFESVLFRIEPQNPEATCKLWNPEEYVDELLTEDMLPISQDYALSLIDAFLVHHVIGLAVQADKQAKAV